MMFGLTDVEYLRRGCSGIFQIGLVVLVRRRVELLKILLHLKSLQ